jgi:hypothetical protein
MLTRAARYSPIVGVDKTIQPPDFPFRVVFPSFTSDTPTFPYPVQMTIRDKGNPQPVPTWEWRPGPHGMRQASFHGIGVRLPCSRRTQIPSLDKSDSGTEFY